MSAITFNAHLLDLWKVGNNAGLLGAMASKHTCMKIRAKRVYLLPMLLQEEGGSPKVKVSRVLHSHENAALKEGFHVKFRT